jgi:RHS repeat-associated protein
MKRTSAYRTSVPGVGLLRALFLFLVCVAFCSETLAQNVQYTNEAVDMGSRGTRRVNPITLGVEFEIPLGRYKGRGGLDVPVNLSYSSKLWAMEFQGYNPGAPPPHGTIEPYTIISANYAEHTVRGWTTTVDLPELDFMPGDRIYNADGSPNGNGNCTAGCYKVDRMMVWMPDGSGHELRASDQPRKITDPVPDNYYAVDGSRMRYQRSTGTLFMADGSRYLMSEGKYVDRNGNTLTSVSGGWRDTLDRTINTPLPYNHGGGPFSAVDQSYSVPGVGTTTINYTLKWRALQDVLTDPSQPLRRIANSGCPPGNGTYSPNLFATDFSGRTCIGNADVLFNPVVLHQIVFPNGRSYTFTYDVYGAISKVVLPTGGYETFQYAYTPPVSSPLNFKFVYAQANRGVISHKISHTGLAADEVQTQYSSNGTFVTMIAPDGTRTENYLWADGVSGWGYSADSSRSGRSYDERVYAPSGAMLRRKLTEWVMTPSNATGNPSGTQTANRNARKIREVEFILDTGGGPALSKSKTYGYDLSFQYDVGLEETSVNEFDFYDVDQTTAQTLPIGQLSVIPNGTLLRTTENDYLTSDANYRSRNLLGLKTATRIKNGSGTVVAQSSNSYDGKTLLTYQSVLNWTDPATTFRGNITSSTRWLNFDGSTFFTYPSGPTVSTHTQYDQCGSPRKIWDPRDTSQQNPSLIDYADTFHRAYPTTNTTADPDGAGPKAAFVTTIEYDLQTGLVLATVDANLQRTEYNYDDPLIRLKRITRAATDSLVKNQTTYVYDDAARTLTATSDLAAFNDNALKLVKYFDGLGRLSETRMYETAVNYIVTFQEYDNMGRESRKSNPYRPSSETAAWTTTAYDSLNRAISVTSPDNTTVTTDYSGHRVLVTDQKLRQRISANDALGRLAEVWEITPSDGATEPVSFPNKPGITAGYLTKYSYDLLDDLTLVTQRIGAAGTIQNRTFTYDSLGRVVTAVNPESGTLNYRYDNNSNLTQKIDSRSPAVTVTDSYDFLNRLTGRSYSDSTPAVTYTYDGTSVLNSKGRLTNVSSSASSYSYDEYDALGRVRIATQTTDGQAYVMNYTHDLAGHLKSQSYPSGRVVLLEYDGAGRTAGVRSQATGLFYAGGLATDDANRIEYSSHGSIGKMKLGNGLWEHTNFNSRLQTTQIGLGTAAANSTVLQLDYSYGTTDNNGNLLGHTITLPGLTLTQAYTYDALNRLETTNENSGNSWKQKFLYDRYGNRRVDSASANTSPDLVGPNPVFSLLTNRIVAQSGEQYLHDGAGNLTVGRDGQTYAFDGENRIKQFNGGAGLGGADYSYDADGRRVKKVVGSVATVFIYDTMGHLIAEYSTAASGGSGTSYLTADHLGTPRVITDASGAVKARHDYLAFGEEIGLKGGRNADPLKYISDTVRQKFTSKERDSETGLDYFSARHYASFQGRFTSPDPFSIIQMRQSARDDGKTNSAFNQFIGDPRRWHRFAYAINSPQVFTDKTGLDIMIIENGPTKGNPIGHTAIAITGRGVYSMGNAQTERQQDGNNNIVGGGVRAYLERETPRRDTTVIIIKTTPQQDAAAEAALINMAKTRPMLQSDATLSTDNCSTRVNEALDAAGIAKGGSPAIPGSAGDRARLDGGTGEAPVIIEVPQNQQQWLSEELKVIQQFEPRPRPSTPIPPAGTPGGTPVVTMPTITRRPDQPQP